MNKSKVPLEKAEQRLVKMNPLDKRRERNSSRMVGAGVEAHQGQRKVDFQVQCSLYSKTWCQGLIATAHKSSDSQSDAFNA